jgi:vacuolar-type H+-ATPase subunit F/Vma7
MKTIVYLGDEANAAGFRLAGVDARFATAGSEAAAFATAYAEAAVLLLGSRCAAKIPVATLAAARLAAQPLLLVLDDGDGAAGADVIEPVRRLLGFAP